MISNSDRTYQDNSVSEKIFPVSRNQIDVAQCRVSIENDVFDVGLERPHVDGRHFVGVDVFSTSKMKEGNKR